MNIRTNVLIVDDEPEIRRFLKVALINHGFEVIEAANGAEGVKFLTSHPPDIVILDLGLPDMDGLDIIRNLREWSTIPVIILSARGHERDKIQALELGADDYLTKPFGTGELLARINVALRHIKLRSGSPETTYEYKGLKIDFEKRLVTIGKEEVHLTPTEYKLLSLLARNSGKVLTHSHILKELWGKNLSENSHYLRIHVQHLRQKLADDPLHPQYIITEPGVGYRLKSD